MNSTERIHSLIDSNTWRSLNSPISSCDPLEFKDQKMYIERLIEAQERTKLKDAIQTGIGSINGIPVALGVMDFYFMGGSMGSVVGEKITRLIELATQLKLPIILICASGGARMQEGIMSLMQMAKIASALKFHQNYANLLYISILTSPTTGGVTASFAMLGDLIIAEPKALIGFAGRRVIEQSLQEQEDLQNPALARGRPQTRLEYTRASAAVHRGSTGVPPTPYNPAVDALDSTPILKENNSSKPVGVLSEPRAPRESSRVANLKENNSSKELFLAPVGSTRKGDPGVESTCGVDTISLLPKDFQTAEYLLNHGLLDLIIHRSLLKQALSEILLIYSQAP